MTVERLMERYGQRVRVCYDGGAGVEARAFVQSVLERREDWKGLLPTPLGTVARERLLYLGEPGVSLAGLERGFLEYRGRRYDVRAAQPVYVGETLSHWWAMLTPRDEEDGI